MLDLILTSGGTGLGVRDFTPEATRQCIDKEISNLALTILVESLKITRFACLSRAVSGLRKRSLIINLPGSKKGSQESVEIVLPVLKHAIDLINDVKREIKQDHVKIQSSPHSHCHHSEHHHKDFSHNETNESRVTESDINSRARESIYPMMTMSDVMGIVMDEASNLEEVEELHYMDALDRICAENILAREPLPPYAASIKDGFALKLTKEQKEYLESGEEAAPVDQQLFKFDVIGSANAGDSAHKIQLGEGQCAKINTGGPVPLNADAVIQIEDTIALEKNERGEDKSILIVGGSGGCGGGGGDKSSSKRRIHLKLGQDIRPVGFDIKAGECVVAKGTLMQAPQCGICATVGSLRVKCFKLPKVALISTGNELQSPDIEHLESGQIRDSNKSLLKAALKSNGIETIVDAGIANDDVNSVLSVFRKAMETADIVISTGGVSMGDRVNFHIIFSLSISIFSL